MNRKLQKIFLVFILGLIQSVTTSYADSGLEVRLSMPQSEYFATDTLTLNFTLTNTTSQAITFLKWETPLENDFRGDMFTINHEGQGVKYIGKIVKRAAPEDDDFVTITAGATLSVSIDLAKGYAIESSGNYTVAFNNTLHVANDYSPKDVSSKANLTFNLAQIQAKTQAVGFKLNQTRVMPKRAKQANFSSCSASQQSTLNDAHAASITIATESRDILNNTLASERASAARYTTWFGSHTSVRYSTLADHFTKIQDGLANQQVRFLCDCNKNFFAYVYPSDHYQIHLCNAFWRVGLMGTDSQAGTLIHEMSHFTVVAGTKDNVYGTTGAKNLAITNPDRAINNADNHEYFAENTPSLSMGSSANTVGAADSFESNDVLSDAKTITAGITQAHSIFPTGDKDWVKFILTDESNVTLTTSGTVGDDTRLFLVNGSTIVENNDVTTTNKFSQITQTGLAAGTYLARVEENGNDAEISAYTLSLASNPTYEPNETQAAAQTIATGSTQSLSISPSTDNDWLKFVLTEISDLTITLSSADGDDILLSLFDASSILLTKQADVSTVDIAAKNGLPARKESTVSQSALAAGTYFVKIEENGNDAEIAAYTVTATSTPVNTTVSSGSGGGGGSLSTDLFALLLLLGLINMSRRCASR